ncbi:uncharacterized protein [Eurosta solidaginis]|uniref:uncharacterized protein n=1 Tax=Eurosta solidaginis TaxID=178769 RepID=UPI003530837B
MASFVTAGGSILSYRVGRFSRPMRFNDVGTVREKIHPSLFIRKSLLDYVRAELDERGRRLFFQRVFIFAKNNLSVQPSQPLSQQSGRSQTTLDSMHPETLDFKLIFQMELLRMFIRCDESSVSFNRPTGFFIYMGDYTIIMLECVEDIVGCVCAQLSAVAEKYFLSNKVFLTEDRTEENFFETFHYFRAAPININEKFPANTITDVELMSQQHLQIKDKLHQLCEYLAEKINNEQAVVSTASTIKTLSVHLRRDTDEVLPAAIFNKVIPEVQRIELVLSCNRFYSNVQRFALLYQSIPPELDDEVRTWPLSYNYTPVGVFRYTPYDVNLTFADYGKKEASEAEKESASEVIEEKGGSVTQSLVLKHLLSKIDNTSLASELSKSINVLEAVYFIKSSWDKVEATTVRNCFRKEGFLETYEDLPDFDPEDDIQLAIYARLQEGLDLANDLEGFLQMDQNVFTEDNNIEIQFDQQDDTMDRSESEDE